MHQIMSCTTPSHNSLNFACKNPIVYNTQNKLLFASQHKSKLFLSTLHGPHINQEIQLLQRMAATWFIIAFSLIMATSMSCIETTFTACHLLKTGPMTPRLLTAVAPLPFLQPCLGLPPFLTKPFSLQTSLQGYNYSYHHPKPAHLNHLHQCLPYLNLTRLLFPDVAASQV